MRLAAVTGLAAEARILQRHGVAAIATAGDPAATAAAAARLVAEGAECLLSFGIAGGLAPGLAPGTVLLPRRVVTETGEGFAVDHAVRAGLAGRLGAVDAGDLLGRDAIALTAAEKSLLHRGTGAAAVDLESHHVAAAAARAGRAFAVLRAVADPAEGDLPQAAAVGLDPAGRAAVLPVMMALLHDPAQLGALLRAASYTRLALRALTRAAAALE